MFTCRFCHRQYKDWQMHFAFNRKCLNDSVIERIFRRFRYDGQPPVYITH